MHLKELYKYNFVIVCVPHFFMLKFLENKYNQLLNFSVIKSLVCRHNNMLPRLSWIPHLHVNRP